MYVTFVTALKELKITSDLGRGDKIDDTTFITNNKRTVGKLIKPEFLSILGSLEAADIIDSDVVVYSKEKLPKNLTPEQFLAVKLYRVKAFEMAIWLLQDNSVNNEQGFLLYNQNGMPAVSSNFIALIFSTALGEKVCLNLRRNELKLIRTFFRENIHIEKHAHLLPPTQLVKGTSRIDRVYYLLQSARGQSDLALRVSQYCSAFETLFTTNPSELTHQLSERVACFLEDSSESKYKTYKALKKAYSFRSKIVHGDVIRESLIGELKSTSLICDDLIRRCLTKIFSKKELLDIFKGDSSRLDEYFLKLLFGEK